jgi:hypothetical protein
MNKKLQRCLNEILNAITNHETWKLAEQVKIQKNHPLHEYRNKYPDLTHFEFTDNDLLQIEELNGFPDHPLTSDHQWTPLEKFFYAVLWKDGKLDKIELIIKGISDGLKNNHESHSNVVYYYFGKHLTNRIKEPLVDQHTMRAWCLIQDNKKDIKNSADITDCDAKNYRSWFLKICRSEKRKSYKDMRLIDSLFFALGKYAKNAG